MFRRLGYRFVMLFFIFNGIDCSLVCGESLVKPDLREEGSSGVQFVVLPGVNFKTLKAFDFELSLPRNHTLSDQVRSTVKAVDNVGTVLVEKEIESTTFSLPVSVREFAEKPGKPEKINLELRLYYCTEDKKGQCYIKRVTLTVPFLEENQNEREKITFSIS